MMFKAWNVGKFRAGIKTVMVYVNACYIWHDIKRWGYMVRIKTLESTITITRGRVGIKAKSGAVSNCEKIEVRTRILLLLDLLSFPPSSSDVL